MESVSVLLDSLMMQELAPTALTTVISAPPPQTASHVPQHIKFKVMNVSAMMGTLKTLGLVSLALITATHVQIVLLVMNATHRSWQPHLILRVDAAKQEVTGLMLLGLALYVRLSTHNALRASISQAQHSAKNVHQGLDW